MIIASDNVIPFRNRLEEAFGGYLETLRGSGQIKAWWYEPMRFKLGPGSHFLPDFGVHSNENEILFYETKGLRREADIVRIRVASGLYPFRFILVTRKAGEWTFEEVRKDFH